MKRKTVLMILLSMLIPMVAWCQEYTITGAGKTNDGRVIVNVVYKSKKKIEKTAQDDVIRSAVMGVMLRGCPGAEEAAAISPIVKDPSVETIKGEFFQAFEREGAYKRYGSIVPNTLTVMKNKSEKCHEARAQVIVDKKALQSYLESADIITGFSDIW